MASRHFSLIRNLLLAAVCATSFFSCGSGQRDISSEIADAFADGDIPLAGRLCDELFEDLVNCNIETLGHLTRSYFSLVVIHSTGADKEGTYRAMNRTVRCFDAAMAKDAPAAKALWKEIAEESRDSGSELDIPLIADAFRTQLRLRETMSRRATAIP